MFAHSKDARRNFLIGATGRNILSFMNKAQNLRKRPGLGSDEAWHRGSLGTRDLRKKN